MEPKRRILGQPAHNQLQERHDTFSLSEDTLESEDYDNSASEELHANRSYGINNDQNSTISSTKTPLKSSTSSRSQHIPHNSSLSTTAASEEQTRLAQKTETEESDNVFPDDETDTDLPTGSSSKRKSSGSTVRASLPMSTIINNDSGSETSSSFTSSLKKPSRGELPAQLSRQNTSSSINSSSAITSNNTSKGLIAPIASGLGTTETFRRDPRRAVANTMTVETETVSAVPTVAVTTAGNNVIGGVKIKKSTDTVNRGTNRAKKKRAGGTTGSKAEIFAAKIASAVDEVHSSDSDETFVYDSNHSSRPEPNIPIGNAGSIRPRLQNRNISSSSGLPTSSSNSVYHVPTSMSSEPLLQTDPYQTLTGTRKIVPDRSTNHASTEALFIAPAQFSASTDSIQDGLNSPTLVYPPYNDVSSANQYNNSIVALDATDTNVSTSRSNGSRTASIASNSSNNTLSTASTFDVSGPPAGVHKLRNISINGNGSSKQKGINGRDPVLSSSSGKKYSSHFRHSSSASKSDSVRKGLVNSARAISVNPGAGLQSSMKPKSYSHLRSSGSRHFDGQQNGYKANGGSVNGHSNPHKWRGTYLGGADDDDDLDEMEGDVEDEEERMDYSETTPLRRNAQSLQRSRKNFNGSFQVYSPHNYQRNRRSQSNFQCIRLSLWFSLGIITILAIGFTMGFLLATSKQLHDVKLSKVFDILVSDEELMFDFVVDAVNPGILSVEITSIDLDIFAKSAYVKEDPGWWDHVTDPDDNLHTMLLGNVKKFEVPLIFEGGFFNRKLQKSVGQLRLVSPGKNVTSNQGDKSSIEFFKHLDKFFDIDETIPQENDVKAADFVKSLVHFEEGDDDKDNGQKRWARVNSHPFDLIIRGVMKYNLLLSQTPTVVSIAKVSDLNRCKITYQRRS